MDLPWVALKAELNLMGGEGEEVLQYCTWRPRRRAERKDGHGGQSTPPCLGPGRLRGLQSLGFTVLAFPHCGAVGKEGLDREGTR